MESVPNLPRVLHCVERMHTNTIESWLARMHRQALKSATPVNWYFHVQSGEPGLLEKSYEELSERTIRSPYPLSDTSAFFREFYVICRRDNYDIVHVHADIMSAPYLLAARIAGSAKLIVHVHNTAIALPTRSRIKARLIRPVFRMICLRADRIVGVSRNALDAMLGGHARRPARDRVIHCGIETKRFAYDERKAREVRRSINMTPEVKLMLFVGGMNPYKNPKFVIEVLDCLHRKAARYGAVFAGQGPYEDVVREMAKERGLQAWVRVLGWRKDVPELMQGCDLLVWPGVEKPQEGLGLGVVEAQAAGLPVLMSRNVPAEAVIVSDLVEVLPLTHGPNAWAEKALALLHRRLPGRHDALAQVEASSFSIEKSLENISLLHTR